MVRFSTVTFWLSFISATASVGTTTLRTARCCPSEITRCSRLCLTLFSWPEYVLTTYQRNIQIQRSLQDEFNDFLRNVIGEAKVGPGDCDEAEHDCGRLEDMTAVGPLHTLELRPAGAQEADCFVAAAQRRAGRALEAATATGAATTTGSPTAARAATQASATAGGACGFLERVLCVEVEVIGRVDAGFLDADVWHGGHAAGATHDGSVELVHVGGGVVERAGHVDALERAGRELLGGMLVGRLAGRAGASTVGGGPGSGRCGTSRCARAAFAALLCTFTVTSHDSAPALTGLPVAGVLATPTAVLAQADPVWIVALALVCLVVAMLALLAGEGDSNSDVSAGHDQKSLRRCGQAALGEEKPRPGARCKQSSALGQPLPAAAPSAKLGSAQPGPVARPARHPPLKKRRRHSHAPARADPCERPRRDVCRRELPHPWRTGAGAADRHLGAAGDVRAPRAAVEGDAAERGAEETAGGDQAQDRRAGVLRDAHVGVGTDRVLARLPGPVRADAPQAGRRA